MSTALPNSHNAGMPGRIGIILIPPRPALAQRSQKGIKMIPPSNSLLKKRG